MIYEPVTETSAMAHVGVDTTPYSVGSLFTRFQNKNRLEISIVSGHIDTFTMVYSVLKGRGLLDNIKNLSADLECNRSDAVVFYQGNVYDYCPSCGSPRNDPVYKNEQTLRQAIDRTALTRGGIGRLPLTIH